MAPRIPDSHHFCRRDGRVDRRCRHRLGARHRHGGPRRRQPRAARARAHHPEHGDVGAVHAFHPHRLAAARIRARQTPARRWHCTSCSRCCCAHWTWPSIWSSMRSRISTGAASANASTSNCSSTFSPTCAVAGIGYALVYYRRLAESRLVDARAAARAHPDAARRAGAHAAAAFPVQRAQHRHRAGAPRREPACPDRRRSRSATCCASCSRPAATCACRCARNCSSRIATSPSSACDSRTTCR